MSTPCIRTEPIVGWKIADILLTEATYLRFASVGVTKQYGVDDNAICVVGRTHAVPANACTCGFHAWHNPRVALAYLKHCKDACDERQLPDVKKTLTSPGLLRACMYGTVVVGRALNVPKECQESRVYRASDQWVQDIYIERKCSLCASNSVEIGVCQGWATTRKGVRFRPLRALCRHHIYEAIDIDRIAAENDVRIHLDYPSE